MPFEVGFERFGGEMANILRFKFGFWKVFLNVSTALGSLSSPRMMSIPADRNPALVPPQPEKKSTTFIDIM